MKTDRASMMHRLEARCPFLDINVVDFARRIPVELQASGRVRNIFLNKLSEA